MKVQIIKSVLVCVAALYACSAHAGRGIPYPGPGPLTADQIAEQVFAATRGGLVKNALSQRNKGDIAMLVNRAALEKRDRDEERKPGINTFETWVNNSPEDPAIESMQMAIFKSGKVKGTGVLFTQYADRSREPTITLWFPALRKMRSINAPAHEDTWGGSNLTYGELVLRRPEHETHELLGEGVLEDCLPVMALEAGEMTRHTQKLPGPQCGHKGKPIYRLKSTTKFKSWWYDYHVSEIDKKSFSLYRTVYYKDGEKVKTVVIDWQSLDQPDPRVSYPRFIYAVTHTTGVDSMVFVPRSTVSLNADIPDSFWSEQTLQKQGRP